MKRFSLVLGILLVASIGHANAQQPQREPTCDELLTEEKFSHGRVLQQLAVERARHQQTQNALQSLKAESAKKEEKKDGK